VWRIAAALVALIGATLPASAQEGPGVPPPPALEESGGSGVVVRAVRLDAPLRIDGVLDEPLYTTVAPVTGFLQAEPHEGQPATERTEVWVAFDDTQVYVSFRSWESQPSRVVANEMRRNSNAIWQGDDLVGFIFDTFYDRRNSALFTVNPIGGRQDGQVTGERQWNGDFNPVWEVKTGRFDGGWTVEAAIPFKSLRYRPGEQQIWGFNALRVNRWKNEISLIVPGPSGQGQQGLQYASIAPTLVGIEAPPPGTNLDVKPYVVANLTSDRQPASPVNDLGASVGIDVKYGLSRNITADLTVNTDFAQVEADEQQVNLTRFSLFFPEKREFFLENRDLFTFGGATASGQGLVPVLFYSRRIGLTDGHVVPIQVGGRVTGRAGRYSFGLLNIRTGEGDASATPGTNFGVVRVKRDILRRSSVGVLFTDRSAGAIAGGRSQAYGIDASLGFFANLSIDAYWAGTRTAGLDGGGTSYRTQLNYDGDRYGLRLERLGIGAQFRPDTGFVRRPGMQRTAGQARFSPRLPGVQAVRKLSWSGSVDYIENGAGVVETREHEASVGIDFENSDTFTLSHTRTYEFLPQVFPIGPGVDLPVGSYRYHTTRIAYTLAQRRRVSARMAVEHGRFYSGGKTTLTVSRGRVNVSPQLSIEPVYALNRLTLAEGAFTSHLAGTRLTYAMTPLMFASALVQYRSDGRIAATNARLRWEYRPGSELFLVYNEERDTLSRSFPALTNRTIVFKMNRLLRF
jgi:hypothetical protein